MLLHQRSITSTEQANAPFLNLDNQQLEQLDNIKLNEGLTGLSVYNNQLRDYPEQIDSLTKLQVLNISCNQIPHIPDSIGQLRALEMLDLGHNKLSELPSTLGQLTELV